MKQFLLMLVLTGAGCGGALIRGPIVPLLTYYLYAVLRPQWLWQFQLSVFKELQWSLYVAGAALVSYLPWVFGVVAPGDPLRRVFPRFVWPHRMMVGFGVWQTCSYLNANDMYRAYPFYEEFVKIFVMYMLASQVVRSFAQVRLLYLAITAALAYISLDVVQNYLMSGYLVFYKRGFAGLDNNGAALMVAMGIPLCYFAWEFTAGRHRWLYLLAIPFIAEAIMSSYSRGAMVATLAAAPFYLLYTRRRKVVLLGMVAGAVAVPFVAGEAIQERFATIFEDQAEPGKKDGSFASRQDSWRAARLIANAYPVFGAGIRCSNLLSKEYGADLEGRTIHNQYLQIAADSGWVGLMWYLALLGTGFASMWQARRRLWREPDEESRKAVALLGGLECSLWVFLFGAVFLSLEMFEPPYLVLFLGSQVWAVATAEVTPAPAARRRVPVVTGRAAPPPPPQPQPRHPARRGFSA